MVYPFDVNYNGTIYKAGENVPEEEKQLEIPFTDDSVQEEADFPSVEAPQERRKRGRKAK